MTEAKQVDHDTVSGDDRITWGHAHTPLGLFSSLLGRASFPLCPTVFWCSRFPGSTFPGTFGCVESACGGGGGGCGGNMPAYTKVCLLFVWWNFSV
jgi:hypothetical protein